MNYLLFKLKFTTPVHFGSSDWALSLYTSEECFPADTLFSALCHTALRTYGQAEMNSLIEAAKKDELRFSDALPRRGDNFYLPKPYINSESKKEVPQELRKAVKKLRWLPVSDMAAFSESIHGGELYAPEKEEAFGVYEEYTRAHVTECEDTVPYQVGAFRFHDDCGLWFLCRCENEYSEQIKKLVHMLGYSGIGGKVSSGFGKYTVEDIIYLDEPFDDVTAWLSTALEEDSSKYLLLTTCLPNERELDLVMDNACYQLTRRGGFVQSETYADTLMKKQTQYYLAKGSVLCSRFDGDVFNVGTGGNHPVYRYSRPILLGVNL